MVCFAQVRTRYRRPRWLSLEHGDHWTRLLLRGLWGIGVGVGRAVPRLRHHFVQPIVGHDPELLAESGSRAERPVQGYLHQSADRFDLYCTGVRSDAMAVATFADPNRGTLGRNDAALGLVVYRRQRDLAWLKRGFKEPLLC